MSKPAVHQPAHEGEVLTPEAFANPRQTRNLHSMIDVTSGERVLPPPDPTPPCPEAVPGCLFRGDAHWHTRDRRGRVTGTCRP